MALSAGTRLGHYDVIALLGEGGMGQVWQATDTQLNREVALKILPDAFAADPDRLARFTREAQILASLNHSNIAQIYGIEEAEGTRALVLELVEGPTLADRISKGPIPLDEALPITKQIAEALEAAHEAGVIHRDLKPANIKVREDGTVKVLDFGLAKALKPDPASAAAANSPTISLIAAATQMGTVIGTAAYMAPEQAKGNQVDRRADIWAFGCVLFEILTARRVFDARDVSEVLASVILKDPDLTSVPTDVPSSVRTLLRRCLVTEPKDRLRDIGEARLALRDADTVSSKRETAATAATEASQAPSTRLIPAVLASGIITAVITGLAVWTMTRPDVVPGGLVRFSIVLPDTAASTFVGGVRDLAISPDGSQVVYKGAQPDQTGPRLYLRPIDQFEGAPLRGGEGGFGPFVSPDGEWVGFVGVNPGNVLQKVSIFGGAPVTLGESPYPIFGASWGSTTRSSSAPAARVCFGCRAEAGNRRR